MPLCRAALCCQAGTVPQLGTILLYGWWWSQWEFQSVTYWPQVFRDGPNLSL